MDWTAQRKGKFRYFLFGSCGEDPKFARSMQIYYEVTEVKIYPNDLYHQQSNCIRRGFCFDHQGFSSMKIEMETFVKIVGYQTLKVVLK